MENLPLLSKNIIIKSHKLEGGTSKSGVPWTRIDIISEENGKEIKYSFFPKKKDGTLTKAMEFYKANKDKWDEKRLNQEQAKVEIAYTEEDYPYVDKKGVQRSGKRRNIKMFRDPEYDTIKQDPEYQGMQDLTDDDLHI